MPAPIINRQEAIDLFQQFMQPASEFRVLRLMGEAKMGKTHLVAKVLPILAEQGFQAHCVFLDLRNQAQTILDVLDAARGLLGDYAFANYDRAYDRWLHRPKVEVTSLRTTLSKVQIRAEDEASEERKLTRHLTNQFVADLRNLTDTPLLLIFDQVDDCDKTTQNWLMHTLLVLVAPLDHVRVVVAGRFVPDPSGSYSLNCHSYELLAVQKVEAYIAYCHQIGASLVEQSIRDFARAFDYKPGLFADYVKPKFARG
jgi:hypothetical protein